MICKSTIRRFDGDASSSLQTAIFVRGATGLRFIAWATIDKGTNRYAADNRAPKITIAWVPREQISEESSTARCMVFSSSRTFPFQ